MESLDTTKTFKLAILNPATAECLHWWNDLDFPEGDILDFGCGSGIAVFYFASVLPNRRVIRSPRLTTVDAALVKDENTHRDKALVSQEVAAICTDARDSRADSVGDARKDVRARYARLTERINAANKKPPSASYNTRPVHRRRFARL